jgi:hypothetical protein
VLEAAGLAEAGVRVLDRLVRKDLVGSDREGEDYRALQLHYGRMGSALGRFVAVRDMYGAASNASVEATQSLLRLHRSEYDFSARGLLACTWLWLNEGARAHEAAWSVLRTVLDTMFREEVAPHITVENTNEAPKTEALIDAWLSAAQVAVVTEDESLLQRIIETAPKMHEAALGCGDIVRAVRVVACHLLVVATSPDEDVPKMAAKYGEEFRGATRVGDGFALAFRDLSLGRWLIGPGGRELAKRTGEDGAALATRALPFLQSASWVFKRQGMHPWLSYVGLQATKAFADLRQFDEAQSAFNSVIESLPRFPIWASFADEVVGQVQLMRGNKEAARISFTRAIQAAQASGLSERRKAGLNLYLNP